MIYIKLILGPYQIINAISYYAEHQKEGTFLVHKLKPIPRHQTAGLDYVKHSIIIQNSLLNLYEISLP